MRKLALLMCVMGGVTVAMAGAAQEDSRALKETRGRKAIAHVVDIMPQLTRGFHDRERVREEMALLKDLGFQRVYFVLNQPGYPSFSDPSLSLAPPGKGTGNRLVESILALGAPNWVYMNEAQRQGMEAWAIIKPYESGSGFTIPHGAKAPLSRRQVETIGGQHIYFDNMLSQHPELRVKRKPEPAAIAERLEEPIVALEVAFRLDPFKQRSSASAFFTFDGLADDEVKHPEIALWLSRDNGRYVEYDGDYTVSAAVERRVAEDANGFPLDEAPKRHLVVTIKELDIPKEYRYVALTLDGHDGLYTIPHSMIRSFTSSGEIPVTAGVHVRTTTSPVERAKAPEEREWGIEGRPATGAAAAETFMDWGFEFEFQGAGFWGDGWVSSPVFGIARGQREFMKGTLCEAYPEVRAYWLDQVQRAVAMGFDGVDIRLQNHSQMVADYADFGYNTPIVERYKERFGVDILEEDADPLKIMQVRGEFFLAFLEEAAEAIHASDKKLQVHLRHAFEEPRLSDDFNELGFWAMPKIHYDWRKAVDLADEVTLKHYYHNDYRPGMAEQIKSYASDAGKRVWVHCYIQQGRELNATFFDAVEADEDIGGILLYEVADAILKTSGPEGGYVEENVATLKALMQRFGYE